MAAINAAHHVLKEPQRRREYDHILNVSVAGDEEAAFDARRGPTAGECLLCGHGPADVFEFSYQNAWIIRATRYTQVLSLCRDCALTLGRSHQNRTLITGWWGVLSLVRNVAVVFTNARGMRRAAHLAPPRPAPDVVAPLAGPLDSGRSVFARSGIYVAAAAFAVLGAVAAQEQEPRYADADADAGAGAGVSVFDGIEDDGDIDTDDVAPGDLFPDDEEVEEVAAEWEIGGCVQGDTTLVPVPCDEYYDGEIIDSNLDPDDCPVETDYYVQDGIKVWCIDEA